MRKMITTAAAIAVLALAGSAQAGPGTVDLSWGACSPIVTNVGPIPQGDGSTPNNVSMFISVIGHDVAHKAYQFSIMYGNATSRTYPDAWAFNPSGCQGVDSPPTLNHTGSKACPSFQGALASLQIKDVAPMPPGLGYETTFMNAELANAYPNGGAGNTTEVNPLTRYFLGSIIFNHVYSANGPTVPGTNCGGLETAICFSLWRANYVQITGETVPFNNNGNRGLTVNTDAGCPSSPTVNKTWGAIKSQYRM